MKKLLFFFMLLPVFCLAQTNTTPQFKRNIPADSLIGYSIPGVTGNHWLPDTAWVKKHVGASGSFLPLTFTSNQTVTQNAFGVLFRAVASGDSSAVVNTPVGFGAATYALSFGTNGFLTTKTTGAAMGANLSGSNRALHINTTGGFYQDSIGHKGIDYGAEIDSTTWGDRTLITRRFFFDHLPSEGDSNLGNSDLTQSDPTRTFNVGENLLQFIAKNSPDSAVFNIANNGTNIETYNTSTSHNSKLNVNNEGTDITTADGSGNTSDIGVAATFGQAYMRVSDGAFKQKIIAMDGASGVFTGINIKDDKDSVGLIGDQLFHVSGDPNQYVQFGNLPSGGSDSTLYKTDGNLTGDRTVNGNRHNLTFQFNNSTSAGNGRLQMSLDSLFGYQVFMHGNDNADVTGDIAIDTTGTQLTYTTSTNGYVFRASPTGIFFSRQSGANNTSFTIDTLNNGVKIKDDYGYGLRADSLSVDTTKMNALNPWLYVTYGKVAGMIAASSSAGNIYTVDGQVTPGETRTVHVDSATLEILGAAPSGNIIGFAADTGHISFSATNGSSGADALFKVVPSNFGTVEAEMQVRDGSGGEMSLDMFTGGFGILAHTTNGLGIQYSTTADYQNADGTTLVPKRSVDSIAIAKADSVGATIGGASVSFHPNVAGDVISTLVIGPTLTPTLIINNNVNLTGNPTTTTQTSGNSSTRIATTAFVAAAISGLGVGTMTSITPGVGFLSHTPITTSGTINVDTAGTIGSKSWGLAAFPTKAFAASTYQPVLVSGTNLKSINSTSLLASGNLLLQTPLTAGTDYEVPLTFTSGVTRTSNTVKGDTSVLQTVLNYFPKGDTRYAKITSAATQSPDYVITTDGTNITASPRLGSGLTKYTGTDAYTIIQDAITALTPSGVPGTGGGRIHVSTGTYNLTNEITITGWESSGGPTSQLIIYGDGLSTRFEQSTSGKNAIVVKNNTSVQLRDFYVECTTSSTLSAILFSDAGTSNISCERSQIYNVYAVSSSSSAPGVYLKNFFDLDVNQLFAENGSNTGLMIENTASGNSTGNSHFGFVRVVGNSSTPFAGLSIKSSGAGNTIDLIGFDNVECIQGFYGIFLYGANNITFRTIDLENVTKGIFLTGASGFQSRYNNFLAGYITTTTGGTAITSDTHSFGNTFNGGLLLDVDATAVPILDQQSGGPANSYDLIFGFNTAPGNISITSPTVTRLVYRVDGGSIVNKLPGVNLPDLTASQTLVLDASKNVTTVALTGTGSDVRSTSPTLVTPALGTPTALVLTNATGLPVSAGISGLGTGIATFLAAPSSANLASAITDETGSGAVVFAGSPAFTGTPTAPTATVGTNTTQVATTAFVIANAGSAAVSSVSNSDGTLTISPTTGAVIASIALGHANTWSGIQTLTTPVLGAATATSINKVAITAPTTSATLTLVTGSTLQTTGAFALNLTSTATTTPTFPTGTGTLSYIGGNNAFTGINTHGSTGGYSDPAAGISATDKFFDNGGANPTAGIGAGVGGTSSVNVSTYAAYFNNTSTVSGIGVKYGIWVNSGLVNIQGLTASKVVFTDASKNLTSTGIGTSSQFIMGDGTLGTIGAKPHTIFTPTTGGTVTLVNNQYNIINPAGALLALTVTLPSSPANNDCVFIKFTQNVTTVTYSGGTVVDGITAPTAGGLTVLTYDSGTTSWY